MSSCHSAMEYPLFTEICTSWYSAMNVANFVELCRPLPPTPSSSALPCCRNTRTRRDTWEMAAMNMTRRMGTRDSRL